MNLVQTSEGEAKQDETMAGLFHKIFEFTTRWGLEKAPDFTTQRHIRLVNGVCSFLMFVAVVYAVIFALGEIWIMTGLSIAFGAASLIPIGMNRLGYILTAKLFVMAFGIVTIFLFADLCGRDVGIQYFLLATVPYAVGHFTSRETGFKIFFTLVIIVAYVLLLQFDYGLLDGPPLDYATVARLRGLTFVFSTMLIFGAVQFLYSAGVHYEGWLQREKERFQSILDHIQDAVVLGDLNYRIIACNRATARYGWPPERLIGRSTYEVLAREEADKISDMLGRAASEGRGQSEVHLLTFEDRRAWMAVDALPMTAPSGKVSHFVLVFRDISEQKEIEKSLVDAREAAEAANRDKSTFLANVSHELRTPLTAIKGFGEILKKEDLPVGVRGKYVDIIVRNAEHLSHLIDDLVDLSTVDAASAKLHLEPCDLHEELRSIVNSFRAQAYEKALTLDLAIDTRTPQRIKCDVTRLRQILNNLLGNSLKFTEQGMVKVDAEPVEPEDGSSRSFQVRVSDTGVGIPQNRQAQLFSPFYQADPTTTRRFGGTGLGLVVSRRVARALGGDVVLESSEEGKGASFIVHLPAPPAE